MGHVHGAILDNRPVLTVPDAREISTCPQTLPQTTLQRSLAKQKLIVIIAVVVLLLAVAGGGAAWFLSKRHAVDEEGDAAPPNRMNQPWRQPSCRLTRWS